MAGKKQVTGGAPAWMVTFADMMALLLCLFVLLLSFSTMDAEKFKRIAGEMEQAFGLALKTQLLGVIEQDGSPKRDFVADPHRSVIEMPPAPEDEATSDAPPIPPPDAIQVPVPVPVAPDENVEQRLADELSGALENEIQSGQVLVEPSDTGVIIRFNSNFLFDSGSADIHGSAEELFDRVSEILAGTDGELLVSGHTDDVPISTDKFRSNWDLSSARAASLVHMLLKNGLIEKERVGATGYADSRPITTNDTPDGRARNRRVEIQVRTK